MEKRIQFRKLNPEDIEVRPATIKDGKATLLCYIDSRSVVELMDEAVGTFNWNMEFEQVGDQIVGKMGIWDESKQMWVVKSDTGSESNIEAGKGLISDIYKRTIARWGLTDLYSIPKIVVDDDGYGCRYQVGEVEWNDDRECTHITLVNKFGKTMYAWSKDAELHQEPLQMKKDNKNVLKDFCSSMKEKEGVDKDDLLRFYRWYEEKCDGWEGPFQVEKLYKSWSARRRT